MCNGQVSGNRINYKYFLTRMRVYVNVCERNMYNIYKNCLSAIRFRGGVIL